MVVKQFVKSMFDFIYMLFTHKIKRLVLVVGQACTLNCVDCGNLAPYSLTSCMKYDVRDILSDLSKVIRSFKIGELQIQGGGSIYLS